MPLTRDGRGARLIGEDVGRKQPSYRVVSLAGCGRGRLLLARRPALSDPGRRGRWRTGVRLAAADERGLSLSSDGGHCR